MRANQTVRSLGVSERLPLRHSLGQMLRTMKPFEIQRETRTEYATVREREAMERYEGYRPTIQKMLDRGETLAKMAKELDVSQTTVFTCIRVFGLRNK